MRGATALLLLVAGSAGAQLTGTVSATTDYRYRGITLSDRKPAVQGGVTYDAAFGGFAGLFASNVRLAEPAGAGVELIGYAGIATRVGSGVSLEAGGDYAVFTDVSGDDYGELFIGVATDSASARLYYSPRYFGQSGNSFYGEVNASLPLTDRLRLVLHGGFLQTRYETYYSQSATQRMVDGRIGVGLDVELFHIEVAWVGVSDASAAYRITGSNSPNTVVLTISHAF